MVARRSLYLGNLNARRDWGYAKDYVEAYIQSGRIFIEPNQMTRCAEASCDFVTVSAQAHGGVDIGPAASDSQKVDRFF